MFWPLAIAGVWGFGGVAFDMLEGVGGEFRSPASLDRAGG